MALGLVNGDDGAPNPCSRLLFQPIADIRTKPCLLGGVSCVLGTVPAWTEADRSRTVDVFRQAASFVPQTDVFASLQGLSGASAVVQLPRLLSAAREGGIGLSRLVFDIEGPFPSSPAPTELLEALESVRTHGVRLSLSRAGLSESGLELALESRPDYLRIGGPLVTGCATEYFKQAIVESIAGLAWKFGAKVIAEGVESRGDLALLRDLGVSYALGPLFCPPMETHALGERLLRGALPLALPPMAVARPDRGTGQLPRSADAPLEGSPGVRQQEHS